MEATTSKEGGLNERGPKAIAHEMGLQVLHGVHSEVGGIQCGGIHQGEECNLDCPELSGTETPFDREEFLSARLFRFHGGDDKQFVREYIWRQEREEQRLEELNMAWGHQLPSGGS